MKKKSSRGYNFSQKKIQKRGVNLLENVIDAFDTTLPEIYWSYRTEEDQNDMGIDMQCELFDTRSLEGQLMFKLQIKGVGKEVKPLIRTKNKGLIAYQLPLRAAKYMLYQIPVAIVMIVSDLKKKVVYWHPIQLDNEVENLIDEAKRKKRSSIQIYIDPNNKLEPSKVKQFISDASLSLEVQAARFRANTKDELFDNNFKHVPDPDSHILNQAYTALSLYFEEFSFIPPTKLIRLFPFVKDEKTFTHYNCFLATINNDDFFDLIKKINDLDNISDPEILSIEDYKNKATRIISILWQSNINGIRKSYRSNEILKVRRPSLSEGPSSCRFQFFSLDFTSAFRTAQTEAPNETIDQKITRGYINYKLGNILAAYNLFKDAKKEAVKKKNLVLQYFCMENIAQLWLPLNEKVWIVPQLDKPIKEIETTNKEKEFSILSSQRFFGKEIIKYIDNNRFFSTIFHKVNDIVDKIEKNHTSQLHGGFAHNNLGNDLLTEMYHLNSFFTFNCIITERKSEFQQLISKITKGLFCSYAMKESQAGKIERFDSFMIMFLIAWGDADTIYGYFDDYNLSFVELASNTVPYVIERIENLFKSYTGATEPRFIEEGNIFFKKEAGDYIEKVFAIATIANLEAQEVNRIIEMTLALLPYNPFHPVGVKHFLRFVRKKGHLIEPSLVQSLMVASIDHPIFHESNLSSTINGFDTQIKILLNEDAFNLAINTFGVKCKKCDAAHPLATITNYYPFFELHKQEQIKEEVRKSLKSKMDFELYHYSAIQGIIPYDLMLDEYINRIEIPANLKTLEGIYTTDNTKYFRPIDLLINMLFMFEHDLSDTRLNKFGTHDQYYEWLLDLENFDYANFNPLWPLHYRTVPYKKKISKSQKVKVFLVETLKTRNRPDLQALFMEYFAED